MLVGRNWAGSARAAGTGSLRKVPEAVADGFATVASVRPAVPANAVAIAAPPSPRHRVLVACAADLVVGFAAVAPGRDRDTAEQDGELVELLVDPTRQGAGHGSRLLAAATDVLRHTWTPGHLDTETRPGRKRR